MKSFLFVLDALFDDLKDYSDRRFYSYSFELEAENDRQAEKIVNLETKIDSLLDRESTLERRAEYWRKMYLVICRKYKKLSRKFKNCPKKSIILYR
jgi:hypothetical protein